MCLGKFPSKALHFARILSLYLRRNPTYSLKRFFETIDDYDVDNYAIECCSTLNFQELLSKHMSGKLRPQSAGASPRVFRQRDKTHQETNKL